MYNPRVSVVLPTYNAAEFVASAVESLLGGNYTDLEIIVVDDGSTDGTLDEVARVADDRVRVIERESSGLPSALNRGIAAARGEYIARQDADDRSHPDRLMRQASHLDAHPEAAGVGSGVHIVTEDGTNRGRRHVLERVCLGDMAGGNPFVHGTMLLDRTTVESVGGYDESLRYTEDYDLWVRLLNAGHELHNLDEPLYELRLRDDSIYGSKLETVKLLRRFAYARATGNVPDDLREAVAAGDVDAVYGWLDPDERIAHHIELAVELLRYGNVAPAREQCSEALALSATTTVAYALYVLSFAPRSVVDGTVATVRWLKNHRVRTANRRRDR